MKTLNFLFAITFLSTFILSCVEAENSSKELETKDDSEKIAEASNISETSIERGKYLVGIMDCHACHSPMQMTDRGPQPIPEKLLSGYPMDRPVPELDGSNISKGVVFLYPDLSATVGPWGISFAGNLTPDVTGLGTWSYEQFSVAMRKGKFKGMENGRDMLPPMPWQAYANLTDEDTRAIFDYLQSIPAVENLVPAPRSPFSR